MTKPPEQDALLPAQEPAHYMLDAIGGNNFKMDIKAAKPKKNNRISGPTPQLAVIEERPGRR